MNFVALNARITFSKPFCHSHTPELHHYTPHDTRPIFVVLPGGFRARWSMVEDRPRCITLDV
jgi:hypothetical protein